MRISLLNPIAIGMSAFILMLLGAPFLASAIKPLQTRGTLNVSVDLVLLDVSVTDEKGRPVQNLERDQFKIYEDKIEQPISYFSSEESPISWGLILDRSSSMQGMMKEVYDAAIHVIDEGTREDEIFIMTFNNNVETVSAFTSDRQVLANSIFGLHAAGSTALYDAVASGLEHLKQGNHRKKVLVVVSDGGDNKSRLRFGRLIDKVRESDALVYTVGVMSNNPTEFRRNMQPKQELEELAEITGAYAHFPTTPEKCREAMLKIAREVSQHYTIGYYPTNRNHDGKWRKTRVALTAASSRNLKYTVRARTGYYGPLGN